MIVKTHNQDVWAAMERRELHERLARAGLSEILAAIDDEACTKSGRLSLVKVARKIGVHHSRIRRTLDRARGMLCELTPAA